MNRKKMLDAAVAIALLVGTSGCGLLSSPPTQRETMAAYGGLAGGAAGAIIGSFAGSAVAGGLFGIPLGAIAGYYIGDQWRERSTREAKADARDTELARLREENQRLKQQASAAAAEKSASAAAPAQPAPVAVPQESAPPRTATVSTQTVLFNTNQSAISPEAKRSLEPVVQSMNGNTAQKITLDGYSDSVGPDAYNQALSQRRSESVKNYLVQNGVSANRITTRGLGKSNPIASNDDDAGRRLNRRVEIIILEDQRTAAARD
jgi:outer membrane protein OmpA-like peptidoglycan-associated protein